MISFSIPRFAIERIARLSLACADDNSPISHIGVRVSPTAIRWSATNGRILASFVTPIEDLQGDPADLILDQGQFVAAVKAASKGTGRISFKIDDTEARVTCGTAASVVRRVSGTFPSVEHVWSRPVGRRWVPTMSSIDPHLMAIAQKLVGKTTVLFSSPVDPAIRLERLWSVTGAQHDEVISVTDLRAVVTAPAYWCDHEMALLLMPISRSDGERQFDLSDHVMPIPEQAATLAA